MEPFRLGAQAVACGNDPDLMLEFLATLSRSVDFACVSASEKASCASADDGRGPQPAGVALHDVEVGGGNALLAAVLEIGANSCAQSSNKSSVGGGVVVAGVAGAEGVGSCTQYGSVHRLAQSPSQKVVNFPRVEGGLEAHDPPCCCSLCPSDAADD